MTTGLWGVVFVFGCGLNVGRAYGHFEAGNMSLGYIGLAIAALCLVGAWVKTKPAASCS